MGHKTRWEEEEKLQIDKLKKIDKKKLKGHEDVEEAKGDVEKK